jgi:hypothetical protein
MANEPDARCFHCGEKRGEHRRRYKLCPFRDAAGTVTGYYSYSAFTLTATEHQREAAARNAGPQLRDALANLVALCAPIGQRGVALAEARAALALAEPVPAKQKGG